MEEVYFSRMQNNANLVLFSNDKDEIIKSYKNFLNDFKIIKSCNHRINIGECYSMKAHIEYYGLSVVKNSTDEKIKTYLSAIDSITTAIEDYKYFDNGRSYNIRALSYYNLSIIINNLKKKNNYRNLFIKNSYISIYQFDFWTFEISYLSKTYYDIKDINSSISQIERKLEINPKYIEGYINLGKIYLKLYFNNYSKTESYIQKAILYFKIALRKDPLNIETLIYLIGIYLNIHQKNIIYEKLYDKPYNILLKVFEKFENSFFSEYYKLDFKDRDNYIQQYSEAIAKHLSAINKRFSEIEDETLLKKAWKLLEKVNSLRDKDLLLYSFKSNSPETFHQHTQKREELSTYVQTRNSQEIKDSIEEIKIIENRKLEEIGIEEFDIENFSKNLKDSQMLCYLYSSYSEDDIFKPNSGMFAVYKKDGNIEYLFEEFKDFDPSVLNSLTLLHTINRLKALYQDYKNDKNQEILEKTYTYTIKMQNILKEDSRLKDIFEDIYKDSDFLQHLLQTKIDNSIFDENFKIDELYFFKNRTKFIDKALEYASKFIVEKIDKFDGVKKITFLTLGKFSMFPLHAIKRKDKYLIEDVEISLLPNLTMLKMNKKIKNDTILFVSNDSLQDTKEEYENIKKIYGNIKRPESPTRSAILQELENEYKTIHFAIHATAKDFINSKLILNEENSEHIKAYELINSNIKAENIILAACETNIDEKGVAGFRLSFFPKAQNRF